MHAHGSKSGVKNETPKSPETWKCLWENQDFPSPKSDFPRSKFDFLQRLSDFQEIRENLLQRLSDFFKGFPLSLTHSTFRNGFLIFLNGFPISSMAFQFSSMAFHFPRNPGKSIYGSKYTTDCYPSFVFQPKLWYTAIKIIGGNNTKDHYPSFVFSAPSFVILAN